MNVGVRANVNDTVSANAGTNTSGVVFVNVATGGVVNLSVGSNPNTAAKLNAA